VGDSLNILESRKISYLYVWARFFNSVAIFSFSCLI
jgi:hypothetical protein